MHTNFFSEIKQLPKGKYMIVIDTSADNLAVTTHYIQPNSEQGAAASIPPLGFNEPASVLDEHYFAAITAPINDKQDLYAKVADHQKALEAAKVSTVSKANPVAGNEKQKFKTLMEQVSALEKQGLYRQAAALCKPEQMAAHATAILERKNALMVKADEKDRQPDLFSHVAASTAQQSGSQQIINSPAMEGTEESENHDSDEAWTADDDETQDDEN